MKNIAFGIILYFAFATTLLDAQTNNYSLKMGVNGGYGKIDSNLSFSNLTGITFAVWAKKYGGINYDYNGDGAIMDIADGYCNSCWSYRYIFIQGRSAFSSNPVFVFHAEGSAGINFRIETPAEGYNEQWVFLAGTIDANSDKAKFYFNGNLVGEANINPSVLIGLGISHPNSKVIGNRPITLEYPGRSYVQDLMIVNYALSQEQIQTLMNCPGIISSSGLLGYWKFDEGQGSISQDESSLNHDITLTNVNMWSTDLPPQNCCPSTVEAHVFLQGPYVSATQLMHDSLRVKNLIPLTEPYSGLPNFTHTGGGGGEQTTPAVLAITGSDAIVDWVFLELRSAANPAQVLATRAALLQRDGDVVDVDGVSPVTFGIAAGPSYSLAVRHRNHLGVQLGAASPYPACDTVVKDFRLTPSEGFYAFNGLNPAEKTVNNTWMLWAGNGQVDYLLKYNGSNNDRNAILSTVGLATPNAIVPGYLLADYNLDGQVKYNGSANDRNVLLGNVGIATPSVILYDQIAR